MGRFSLLVSLNLQLALNSHMTTNAVIDNRTLINEEQLGNASQYLVHHQTQIRDPEVRERITEMSIEEVIG